MRSRQDSAINRRRRFSGLIFLIWKTAWGTGSQAWPGCRTTRKTILEINHLDSQVHSWRCSFCRSGVRPGHSISVCVPQMRTKVTSSNESLRHCSHSLVFHSNNCLFQVPKPIRSSYPLSHSLKNPNWTISKRIAWQLTTFMRTQKMLKSKVGS